MKPSATCSCDAARASLLVGAFLALGCEAGDPHDLDVRGDVAPASAAVPTEDLPPVLVGAGDIAGCGVLDEDLERPRDFVRLLEKLVGRVYYDEETTANLLDSIPGVVFTTGDNAYPRGRWVDFRDCYEPAWGRHRDRTRPTPGNHDYGTSDAAGYFEYFGPAAGDPERGYYSYTVNGWLVLALNTVLPISPGSPQLRWVREELTAHGGACSVAYGHDPRFSSGKHGSDPELEPLWRLLHGAGVELLMSGHDHHYERFDPLGPDATPDLEHGVRQFVVGTGGAYLREVEVPAPHSRTLTDEDHGLLRVTLHPDRYEWEFVPIDGDEFTDRGDASCHAPPPDGWMAEAAADLTVSENGTDAPPSP